MMAWPTVFVLTVALVGVVSAEDSVTISATCPDICLGVGDAFASCARYQSIGCTLKPCSDQMMNFTCAPNVSDTDLIVTPGGEIVIDKVRLYDYFKFNVDLKAVAPVKTDLYLLSDATGSMGTAIATAKSKFQDIITYYEGTKSDTFFGVGFYRDESELAGGFKNVQSMTGDRAAVKSGIDTLSASGGGDRDEANLAALYKVATDTSIGWRDDSRKIIVYFGDNPGHEPSCVGGLTITRTTVIDALNAKGITVIGASFGSGFDQVPSKYECGSGSAGARQGTDIAEGTGGRLVPSKDQAELIQAIIGAVKDLPKTFDVDTSDCDDKLRLSTVPALPITLAADETATIEQTLFVLLGVCEGSKSFDCQLRYTEGGASLPPSTVKVLDVEGCPT